MKWVLIVATWVTSGTMGGGYHVASIPEFSSKASCEAAAAATVKATDASTTKTTCVQQ